MKHFFISLLLCVGAIFITQSVYPSALTDQRRMDVNKDFLNEIGRADANRRMRRVEAKTLPDNIPDTVTTTRPKGTVHENMYKKSHSWFYGGITIQAESYGMYSEIVEGDDGYVYFLNPFGYGVTDSYLKGERVGDEKVVFHLPQPIYNAPYGQVFWAWRMKKGPGVDYYYVDEEESDIEFTYVDGNLKMIGDGTNETIIGMAWPEGIGFYYGDWDIDISAQTDVANTMPEGVERKQYQMTDAYNTKLVEVAVEGDDVYLTHLPEMPEDWVVKGKVSGGKVLFDDCQYLGVHPLMQCHSYFLAVDCKLEYDEYYQKDYDVISLAKEAFEMDLDGKTGVMSNPNHSFVINVGKEYESAIDLRKTPVLKPWSEVPATPQTPEVINVTINEYTSMLQFRIKTLDTEQNYMNEDKLFYRVYDGDELFVFTPGSYGCLTEDATEIPVNMVDNESFFTLEDQHVVFLDRKIDNPLGLQIVYRGGNDERSSEIAYFGGGSQVDEIDMTGKSVVSEIYLDTFGRRVAVPEKGLYVKMVKYDDGSTVCTKLMR